MVDTETLLGRTDLKLLVEQNSRLHYAASTGGGEYAGPCPFNCGCDHDGFRVQLNHKGRGQRWFCRGCSPQWRTAIGYVMRRDDCDVEQACETLAQTDLRAGPRPPQSERRRWSDADWQRAAQQVVDVCERNLEGAPQARTYLNARGLSDETQRRWHLGYAPAEGNCHCADGTRCGTRIAGLFVPHGVVIPCEVGGRLWYVKVRRPTGEPRYMKVSGSTVGLFAAQILADHDTAVLCEGEFDAMLLEQEAGDLVGVATLGSALDPLDVSAWAQHLLPVSHFLLAYDADARGERGAQRIAELSARMKRAHVPRVNESDKDITDYWKAGGRLRDWVLYEIERHSSSSQPPKLPKPDGTAVLALPTYEPAYTLKVSEPIEARDSAPETSTQAGDEGRWIGDFLQFVAERQPFTDAAQAWQRYHDWCVANDYAPMPPDHFARWWCSAYKERRREKGLKYDLVWLCDPPDANHGLRGYQSCDLHRSAPTWRHDGLPPDVWLCGACYLPPAALVDRAYLTALRRFHEREEHERMSKVSGNARKIESIKSRPLKFPKRASPELLELHNVSAHHAIFSTADLQPYMNAHPDTTESDAAKAMIRERWGDTFT